MKKKQTKNVVSQKSESKVLLVKTDQAATIVKIVSVLEYIGAGFCILFGFIMLFGGQFFLAMLPVAEMPQVPAAMLGAALVVIAIVMLAFGIFAVFIARALWLHKNWARIITIILSAMSVLAALFSLPQGIIGLLLHGAIVYFLGFDKNVVALFK